MNYEELLSKLTETEKELKDGLKLMDRLSKSITKSGEAGNLTDLRKAASQLTEAVERVRSTASMIQEEADSFDSKAYIVSGEFTKQLLEACKDRKIDVKGEMGVYEMFPYKVRILGDEEHAEEIWINRKKLSSCRPSAVADTIKDGQEKLNKAGFNHVAFLNELAEAYDTVCQKAGVRIGTTQTLTKVYKALTPMARARKEYDIQAFAFDLSRLFEKGSEAWVSKDGRQFIFGTSRDAKNAVRVLSSTGVENYIITIKSLTSVEGD